MKKSTLFVLALCISMIAYSQEDDRPKVPTGSNIMKQVLKKYAVDIEDSYEFDQSITYESHTENKKGKEKSQSKYKMYFTNNGKTMGIEVLENDNKIAEDKMLSILDFKNEAMISLIEDKNGSKTGVAMKIPKERIERMVEKQEDKGGKSKFTKTSETKTILGYECTKYLSESDDMTSVFWVSNKMKFNVSEAYAAMFGGKKYAFENMPAGSVLEAVSTSKKKGDKMYMKVTNINDNDDKNVEMNQYEVTNIGSVMGK